MSARGDARKRQASPISMHSDAHNGLTEAERAAVNAAACGNCGERTAVLNLVARIKAEAVQAERERIAREFEDQLGDAPNPSPEYERYTRHFARIARGEGRWAR